MKTTCDLCFRHCSLEEGQTGFCRARTNQDGEIICINYGRLTGLSLDPIEKKPLRRFRSGSMILSLGSFGCNLRCPFCQNHAISMADEDAQTVFLPPEGVAQQAAELRHRRNIGVAYTYNEPLIGYEFVRDCAALVRERGMVNVAVTNGTIEEKPWRELLPLLDAVNIDLKGFTTELYRKLGGDFESVKRSIKMAAEICHLEVTTLVIPSVNDSDAEIRSLSQWLAGVNPEIPLHLSRFFPRYQMENRLPTPVERIYQLAEIAGEALPWVYTGNC